MALTLDGSNGVTFNDASLQGAAASPLGLKNRIINGAMVIDQRNAGASLAVGSNFFNAYCLDRWSPLATGSKYSVQQNAGSVTPPVGFSNYLGITSNSSYTLAAGDYFAIGQRIEGFNFADLDWGTANAKTITISAWVRSSLTGTFGGAIANSAQNRSYPFSYTISSANTWTQISVTIAGDTTGTWIGSTNGIGLSVYFAFGVGSTYSGTSGSWQAANLVSATGATSVVGTNGATFYITGVQLEQNTTATPFERRLYNAELANCQRYYFVLASGTNQAFGMGSYQSATYLEGTASFPVQMRATATSEVVTGTNYYGLYAGNVMDNVNSLLQEYATTLCSTLYNTTQASGTTGQAGWMTTTNASAKIAFSAEL